MTTINLNNQKDDQQKPDPFHSELNQARLLRAAADMESGNGTVRDLPQLPEDKRSAPQH